MPGLVQSPRYWAQRCTVRQILTEHFSAGHDPSRPVTSAPIKTHRRGRRSCRWPRTSRVVISSACLNVDYHMHFDLIGDRTLPHHKGSTQKLFLSVQCWPACVRAHFVQSPRSQSDPSSFAGGSGRRTHSFGDRTLPHRSEDTGTTCLARQDRLSAFISVFPFPARQIRADFFQAKLGKAARCNAEPSKP